MQHDPFHGRWYGDACGAALGMELLGERWSVPILRELLLGRRRFSELRRALPGISARVLSERLAGLEAQGVLCRAEPFYALTPWGQATEPLMLGLCRWALQAPGRNMALPVSPVALVLSLRALIRPERAGDWAISLGLCIESEDFTLDLAQGCLSARRGPAQAPVFIATGDTASFKCYFYGHLPPEHVPGLALQGDLAAAARFAALFDLPAQA